MTDSPFLSNREAADYLGMSINTLNFWRHRGKGPSYTKFGSTVKYRRSDLEAYAQAATVEPSNAATG